MTLNGITIPDNTIQRARLARTAFWNDFRVDFMEQLTEEISKFRAKAERKGLIPVVRLNGTSDIRWEKQSVTDSPSACTIFDVFPGIQFYDYTKIPKRFEGTLPKNYHLCLSYSEASLKYADKCLETQEEYGASLVWVALDPKDWMRTLTNVDHRPVVNGDENDLRFLDPPGANVVLKAKGLARGEHNGFVIR